MSNTPPWWTDDWELSADLDKIRQQWVLVRHILEDEVLSERRDDSVSAWSCGEQAVHILLIGASMVKTIEANLDDPTRHADEVTQDTALRLFRKGGFRRGAATAPPDFHPERTPAGERLDLLTSTANAWDDLRARSDEIASSPGRARHFALGYLNSVEWVRMCAVHNAHHLRIVRDIAGEDALLEAS